jgi:protocatechuate 3,4-dioxygenase beta subunit
MRRHCNGGMAHDLHDIHHDLGLAHDLDLLLKRRRGLLMLAGAGALGLLGCGGGGDSATTTTATSGSGSTDSGSSSGSTGSTTTSCSVIPEETAGPYPGDGSNGVNALALSGIVRSDIRSSIAGASGTAQGVPLTVTLQLVNTGGSCADLAGYAIYLWHCDRDGKYSLYSSGITDQNYLRGVQETGSDGTVTFTTVFPACYSGRWPHIHFEVYRSLTTATSFSNRLKTSQLAMPEDVCRTVYNGASGYSASVSNLNQISLATDNVFSDGATLETPSVVGSLADGYAATLTVGISV